MNRPTLVSILLLAALAAAEDKPKRQPRDAPAEAEPVISSQEAIIGGRKLAYVQTAGRMAMTTEAGEATAHIFYMAYTRADADLAKRPVTFVFNGGPGSASIWLHLGAVGPKRVVMSDKGTPLPPPGRFADNADSWLDRSDLVFIDPVGTGYSRPAKGHKQSEFSGLREDTQSVGEFIRRYVARYRRWRSPKFLAGESYGTTRAASLAGHLQDRYGMYLNGIVLVSSVLNFQTIRFGTGNDLPHVMFLPSYAATAFYHGRLGADLQKDLQATLEEVKAFAIGPYLAGLARGDALPAAARAGLVKSLARYTGLSEAYIERSDLRIPMGRFGKELLRDQGRTVGRLDARLKGIDRDSAGGGSEYDPSMAAIDGPYSAAFKDYVRTVLRYESDLQYRTLGGVGRWKYPEGRYVNVAETLRRAMTKNRHLKVMVACGYFDLATPFFGAEYTVHHLGLDPSLRDHVRLHYYEAGHMMYIHAPSRRKLKQDVAAFFDWATGAAVPGAGASSAREPARER